MTAPGVPAFEHLLRELAPRVLSRVVRRASEFGAAEDAVQEALLAASQQWPRDGLPTNPAGWLVRVARRRLADEARAELARRRRETFVVMQPDPAPEVDEVVEELGDETLALLFLCCHPSLPRSSAIALTLRAVGGLTTSEIANAYLVPDTTMGQRISRAKASIAQAGARFELPSESERGPRLAAVLHVLYLMFNEGYAPSSGALLVRTDLCEEAIRLARLVVGHSQTEPEALGLLALLLLTHARRAARSDESGVLVPLDEQNRSLWDRSLIEEGQAILPRAFALGAPGPYQVQAAIAALHDEAASAELTDWRQILALYQVLLRMSDNPTVRLNHAIALAMVDGPEAGLAALARLESEVRVTEQHRWYAVHAHLLEKAGRLDEAESYFKMAIQRATNEAERNYLRLKVAALHQDRS